MTRRTELKTDDRRSWWLRIFARDSTSKVVEIVSRANLVQALAMLRKEAGYSTSSDSTVRKKVMALFKSEPWSRHSLLNATVQNGTVTLWGIVDSEAEKDAARVAAEQVPGVQWIA